MEADVIVEMLLFTGGALSLLVAVLFARRGLLATSPYLLLLVAETAACLWLFLTKSKDPVPIAFALSGFTVLIVIPLFLASFARRFAQSDRFQTAANLLLFRLPFVPSPLSLLEIRIHQAFEFARQDRFDEAMRIIQTLREGALFRSLQPLVDEAYFDLCLKTFRWTEADAYLDTHGDRFEQSHRSQPRLLIYALRVRCERGRLKEAAGILQRITENTPAKFSWGELASAYMILLACAGEEDRLRILFQEYAAFLSGFPESVRDLWLGRAHVARGNEARADILFQSALEKAQTSDPQILQRIERQVEETHNPAPSLEALEIPWPPPLPSHLPYISPQAFATPRAQRPIATTCFVLLNVTGLWLVSEAGRVKDIPTLVSLGANVKFLIESGQVWRLGSSTLLHFNWVHLILNGLGLLFLGRLVENIYGSARFLVIYILAGYTGGLISTLLSEAQLSVGASGAIFGLVGAGIAFLVFYGSRLPMRTRGMYLFLFLFVAVADTVFSVSEAIIDTHAHLGGLGAGIIAGALLRPVLGSLDAPSRFRRFTAPLLAGAAVASLAFCVAVAGHNYVSGAPFPSRIAFKAHRDPSGAYALPIPAHWQVRQEEGERDLPLADQAHDIERRGFESTAQRRPLMGPRLWHLEGGGRTAVVYEVMGENRFMRRSIYVEEGDRLARISFGAREEILTAFERVERKIVTGFSFGH
ncbi:MAG: rhomboid family intramembrane serine protease [Planctomycetota bacterium]|jgi:membrane associated rhomboid family serine protease